MTDTASCNSSASAMKVRAIGVIAICALALTLAGCIQSSDPILINAQPVFGPQLRFAHFALDKGYARAFDRLAFKWNGAFYAHRAGGSRDIPDFSVFPFEGGDYIVQTVPARRAGITEYALLRRLADGVFLVVPIDSEDADEPTRDADCARGEHGACRVMTRAQLFAFARATAARHKDTGGLVIRLPDAPERHGPRRHHRR